MWVNGDNREFGDLGRFRVGNVFRPVTSVVSAVAKPVAAIAKPIVKPIASVARPVFNPVNSAINRVTGGSPILKLGIAAVVPGTTLAVASSLRRDYSAMQAVKRNASPFEQASDQYGERRYATVEVRQRPIEEDRSVPGSVENEQENRARNDEVQYEGNQRSSQMEIRRQENRGEERGQGNSEENQSSENISEFSVSMSPPGKKITVYAEDGSEGEIDSSLLRRGEYTENGMVWRTAPKEGNMGKQSKTVTVYAPDGTVGDVRADLVKNGRYIEDGVVWTTSPQMDKSGMTFWQKIVAAIGEGNARAGLSGFGDVSMAPGTDLSQIWSQGQSSGVASMFDRLSNTVSRVQSTATAGRKLAQAIRGKKPTPGVPANAGGGLPEKTDTIMGLPPAVVYGVGSVLLAGGAYIVVKKIRNRK